MWTVRVYGNENGYARRLEDFEDAIWVDALVEVVVIDRYLPHDLDRTYARAFLDKWAVGSLCDL